MSSHTRSQAMCPRHCPSRPTTIQAVPSGMASHLFGLPPLLDLRAIQSLVMEPLLANKGLRQAPVMMSAHVSQIR